MGLRALLGLPDLPDPGDATGAAAWQKSKEAHQKLAGDRRLAFLPAGERATLANALKAATVVAQKKPSDAARQLNAAVGVAAKALLALKDKIRAYEADLAEAESILKDPAKSGIGPSVAQINLMSLDRARKAATTDITLAATEIHKLVVMLRKQVGAEKDKTARDPVEKAIATAIAAAETALKVDTLTPTVKAAHDDLARRLPLLDRAYKGRKFHVAQKHLDIVAALAKTIMDNKSEADKAAKLRDDVMASRSGIDAKIVTARKVFAVDPDDEPVLQMFEATDKQFEGAVLACDFRTAKALFPLLESRADMVMALKSKSDPALAIQAEKAAFAREVADLQTKTGAVPRVNYDLGSSFHDLKGASNNFWQAWNGNDIGVTRTAFADYKAKAEAFLVKATSAEAEIKKVGELRKKIEDSIRDRYIALTMAPAVTPAMVGFMQTITATKIQVDGHLAASEFNLAETSANYLLEIVVKAEAEVAANKKALETRAQLLARIDASKAVLTAPFAYVPNTPSFKAAIETYTRNHAAVMGLIQSGNPAADAAIDGLIVDAGRLVGQKAADDSERAKIEAAARKRAQDLAKPFIDACADLQPLLPDQKWVLDDIVGREANMRNSIATGQFLAATEHAAILEGAFQQLQIDIPKWTQANVLKKADALLRRDQVVLQHDAVKTMKPVTPVIADLLKRADVARQKGADTEGQQNWGGVKAAFDELATLCTDLSSHKAAHDLLLADQAWIDTEVPKLRADAKDVWKTLAYTAEMLGLRDRLSVQMGLAEKALAKHDPKGARAMWVKVQEMKKDCTDKAADNLAAQTVDAKAVVDWLSANTALLLACDAMTGVTPEIKAAVARYVGARNSLMGAYGALDWPQARTLLQPCEDAAKDLVAMKPAHDIAVPQAEATRDKAKKQLGRLTPDELKAKPAREKLELLDRMRATGKPLEKDERDLQRKLLASLDYEEDFRKKDTERRGKLVDALTADDEIVGARTGWAGKSDDERVKIIAKAVTLECKIYDIPAPPIRLFCKPPLALNGFFDPVSGTINLNCHPQSSWADYAEALNTAVHENAHNYQSTIAARQKAGLIEDGDDEYVQAMIFDANEGDGYMTLDEIKGGPANVPPDVYAEAITTYKSQPLERHAYDTGDGIARGVMEPANVKRGVVLQTVKDK